MASLQLLSRKLRGSIIVGMLCFSCIGISLAQNNGGFENWTTVGTGATSYEEPVDWQTFNILSVFGNPISTFKVSGADKYSGNYALKVVTVYLPNKMIPQLPDSFGAAFNGKIILSPPSYQPGRPYTSRPTKLGLYAKYLPVGVDSAQVTVTLSRNLNNVRDTIAFGQLEIASCPSYSFFQLSLNYRSNATPDSASIFFATSNIVSPAPARRLGSSLFLDDISFILPIGTNEYTNYSQYIKIYPQPATDVINISNSGNEGNQVEVFNFIGQPIGKFLFSMGSVAINTTLFKNGCYFYKVLGEGAIPITRGQFIISK
jgi:hypothetical protein